MKTSACVSSYGRELLGRALVPGRFSEDGFMFALAGDVYLPRVTIHLKDRGRTEAIRVQEVPAPLPPKARTRGKPVRWHNGQWVRYLARGPEALGCDFPPLP
jgi:hypothetical protein